MEMERNPKLEIIGNLLFRGTYKTDCPPVHLLNNYQAPSEAERNSMQTIQYKNHPRQKESFIENERLRLARFQDPRDMKWYAFVETKDDGFHMFSGPHRRKISATEQVRIWMSDDTIDF